MIRIYTWPDVVSAVNPYLRLFYRALEPWQVVVPDRLPVNNARLRELAAEIDVLHLHWWPDGIWRSSGGGFFRRLHGLIGFSRWLRLARRLGKKIIWTIHDLESHDGSDFLDRWGYRMLVSHADLCIFLDEEARRQGMRRFGCRPEKTMVILHGNYDGEYPPPADRRATRTALGLDPKRPTLLCFGVARPYKGYDLAIDAMRQLPPTFQLVVAGHVLDLEYGKLLQRKAGDDPRVRLVLRELSAQESSNYMSASDCVLLPYRRITGSGVLMAAFSLGRGVVASDFAFFRSALAQEPDAGVLFRPADPADLAAAVQRFFAAPLAVRHAAARRVADQQAWSEVVRPVGEWLHRSLPERLAAQEELHS
jgi:glycosyltransferase involved in cell wall biosynthesis